MAKVRARTMARAWRCCGPTARSSRSLCALCSAMMSSAAESSSGPETCWRSAITLAPLRRSSNTRSDCLTK
eukprot:7387152-Prymnesium_polylepis.2